MTDHFDASNAERRPGTPSAEAPSVARIYDALLGGSNNLPVDREAAERLRELEPNVGAGAWANRGFHQRAVRELAAEAGIAQFVDIGSGLPTESNTHEIVQAINPDARVVYVDNDLAAADLAKRLISHSPGTAFISGDLREPDKILNDPDLQALIDPHQPVGLSMTAVLHFVSDDEDPWGLVARYLDALAAGSYLALSHATFDHYDPALVERIQAVYRGATAQFHPRSRPEVERFFTGLELVPPFPGARPQVTFGGLWGAEDPALADDDSGRWFYAGVARKPGDGPQGTSLDVPVNELELPAGWAISLHEDTSPGPSRTGPSG